MNLGRETPQNKSSIFTGLWSGCWGSVKITEYIIGRWLVVLKDTIKWHWKININENRLGARVFIGLKNNS